MSAEPNWISYLPMILGSVGAITGVLSYRNSKNFKSLDLRIELRKSCQDLILIHESVMNLLESTDKSRKAIYAASGQLDSGAMVKWTQKYEEDYKYLHEMSDDITEGFSFANMNTSELEDKLVEVSGFTTGLRIIEKRYLGYLEEDSKQRDAIRHGLERIQDARNARRNTGVD